MDIVQIVLAVVLTVAGVLCVVAIWALRDLVATSRSVRMTSEQVRMRLVPLLEKADVSVDAFNMELLRVDAIITQFEDTTSRVSHASATISDIVNTPAEMVSEAATRVRQAWKDRKRPQSRATVVTESVADNPESHDRPRNDDHVS